MTDNATILQNVPVEVEKENIIYSCLDEDYIAYEEAYKGV